VREARRSCKQSNGCLDFFCKT